MTVFQGAVDATFAAFGIDAVYTPAGGDPVSVRVIARRPDTIVGFGDTRIHAETATFEVRASEVANPRPGDQLTVGGDTSSSRASRSGAIPSGSCGQLTQTADNPDERLASSQRSTVDVRYRKSEITSLLVPNRGCHARTRPWCFSPSTANMTLTAKSPTK